MTLHQLEEEYEVYGFDFAKSDYINTGNSGYSGVLASVYNVEFDPLEREAIAVGEAYQWMRSNPDKITLTFVSEDESIASVNDEGLVTGNAQGTTIVKARNEELGIEQKCEIIVEKAKVNVVSFRNLSIKYKETAKLGLEINPLEIKPEDLNYRSKNSQIVTVSSDGKVTGARAGSTLIEVSYEDIVLAEVPVTVKPSINSKYKNVTVSVGKKVSLKDAVAVSSKSYKDLIFKSSDGKVATVDKKGTLTGRKKGKCSIKIYDIVTKKLAATVKVTIK